MQEDKMVSRRKVLVCSTGLAALAVSSPAAARAGQRSGWQAGFAQAEITPRRGYVQMRGFGRERYAKGAIAPLLAQVVALRDATGRIGLIIAADLSGFDRVNSEAMRRAIGKKHDVAPEAIVFSASHTHWGPAVRFRCTFAAGAPNVWYMAWLEEQILAAVDGAIKDLAPATIEYGAFEFRGIGCNRRLPKDGRITWGPYPEGSFDPHTPVLRLRRDRSPKQILLVGHACHPTSSGKIEKWSPDYPGAMRDYLAANLPDTKAVFVQGCGGDAKVVHKDPKTGKLVFSADPQRSKEAGEKLGRAVCRFLETGELTGLAPSLAAAHATGRISYGEPWPAEEIEREAYTGRRNRYYTWVARQHLSIPDRSDSFRYDVQVWKLGDRLTVFITEGEMCSPWGPKLRAMAPTPEAMVISYATDVTAYIPDARIVREGGYEGGGAQKYFLPGPFTESIEPEVTSIVKKAVEALG
jgi:hypothetical protein